MLSPDKISDRVAEAVASISYPSQPAGLYEPIAYTLESGGKRLRPQLTLAVCSALGGDVETAINAALGVEIFHNFTLLHDDVMDAADMRRGRPTVHIRWNDNTAILSATSYIAGTPAAVMPEVMALFNRTAMEVYEGQQYDIDFEKRNDVTVAQYMEMIRLKTSVLLGCACCMGAIVAEADRDVADAFYDYGVNLGGDIINAKKTWLLINAMAECRTELLDILAEDLDPEERVNQVRAVYDRLGLDGRCRSLIAEYADKAISSLDDVTLGGDARDYFTSLARRSVDRSY